MIEIILTSSVLILLLAVLRRALRGRIDPRVQYALWLLVAARLLIPGTLFTAPVSVLGATEGLQTALHETFPDPDSLPEPPINDITAQLPAAQPAVPVSTEHPDNNTVVTTHDVAAMPEITQRVYNWPDIIWKTGIALVSSAILLSNLAFYLRLRKSRKLLSLPAACWAGGLPVYEADGLPSPCLFGLFQPAVYLNETARNTEHPEHILAHEYAHYRHGDHLWSILRSICLVIHWYNPLVWWAAALSRRDCELACDTAALKRLGEEERIGYGQTLLGMVSQQISPASLSRTATTMTAGKRAMTERIALIVRQPRTRKITLALVAVLACLLAACSFGGKAEEEPEPLPASSMMEFPGLHWNDTPEAVMEALGITEADFLQSSEEHEDDLDIFSFLIEDYPLYGATAQYVIFRFVQYVGTGHGMGLYRVEVCYPDDMEDFGAVRDELSRQFGPEAELSEQRITANWENLLGDRYDRWVEIQNDPGIKLMSWTAGPDSDAAEAARSIEENYQSYREMSSAWAAYMDPPRTTGMPEFEKFLEEFTGARVTWSCNSVFMPTFNTVIFDGTEYVYYSRVFSVTARTRNAGILANSFHLGNAPGEWLSYMHDLSWDALRQASVEMGLDDGDGTGFALEILEAVSQYAGQDAFSLTSSEYAFIFTATDGLDGALEERYAALVRQLHDLRPSLFANTVIEVLHEENREIILDYYSGGGLSQEEVIAQLYSEAAANLTAGPEEIILTKVGQTGQFLLDAPLGDYTVSYTSSDLTVAKAMPDGTILALTPGEANISLTYEGDLGHYDFVCHVICDW